MIAIHSFNPNDEKCTAMASFLANDDYNTVVNNIISYPTGIWFNTSMNIEFDFSFNWVEWDFSLNSASRFHSLWSNHQMRTSKKSIVEVITNLPWNLAIGDEWIVRAASKIRTELRNDTASRWWWRRLTPRGWLQQRCRPDIRNSKQTPTRTQTNQVVEIGRASCRERV